MVTGGHHTEVKPNVILSRHRLGTEVRPEHHVGVASKVVLKLIGYSLNKNKKRVEKVEIRIIMIINI